MISPLIDDYLKKGWGDFGSADFFFLFSRPDNRFSFKGNSPTGFQ
jgi:hypothetical protein